MNLTSNEKLLPSSFRVVFAVGWVTFLEAVRDRILYNIFLCSLLLFGLGYLASRLTFIHPDRVMVDFGLSGVAISCHVIAIFSGSGLLGKEFERRTIYVALSYPITRAQFIVGKFFGLFGVIAINWVILSILYLSLLLFTWFGMGGAPIPFIVYGALGLVLIQTGIVASAAVFFSTFSTTALSVVFSIGMYLIGQNISQLRFLGEKIQVKWVAFLLKALSYILPNLESFNLGTQVTYGLPVSLEKVALSVGYGGMMVALFLGLAGILIQSREI